MTINSVQHRYLCNNIISVMHEHSRKILYRNVTFQACQTVCQIDALMDRCGCFEQGAEEIVMIKNSTAHPCRTQRGRSLKIVRSPFVCEK